MIAQEIEGPLIVALARCLKKDIEAAHRALGNTQVNRKAIHVFIGTSLDHMAMLRKSHDEVLRMAVDSVKMARSYYPNVEFSAMDATRTDQKFLLEILEAVIDAGATTVNIPDTVGYAMPYEFADLITVIKKKVSNIDDALISVHCHNDLNMADANSLVAVHAGADKIHATINGLGERAGNASVANIVMAIQKRSEYYGAETGVITENLARASDLVAYLTGFIPAPNTPIVGRNAFSHSSGIHQHGILTNRNTFEIMEPAEVGRDQTEIVLNAQSGRHALKKRLEDLGYVISSDDELERVYNLFLGLADAKGTINDDDLRAIIGGETIKTKEDFVLEMFRAVGASESSMRKAFVVLKRGTEMLSAEASGDGPIDAVFAAIEKVAGIVVPMREFFFFPAQGRSSVASILIKIRDNGDEFCGRGASTDTIEAAAKAYVEAINLYVKNRAADYKTSEPPKGKRIPGQVQQVTKAVSTVTPSK